MSSLFLFSLRLQSDRLRSELEGLSTPTDRRVLETVEMLDKLRRWARALKQDVTVLYFAYQDPRVSWAARLLMVCVVAYAFSPIDLIPDFIPVLGYLDDLILVPLGVFLALKLIPEPVLIDCRSKADAVTGRSKPKNWVAGGVILIGWLLLALWLALALARSGPANRAMMRPWPGDGLPPPSERKGVILSHPPG